jgi:hypothetical protein
VVDLAFGHSCAAGKDMKRKRKQKRVKEARNEGQELGDLASRACPARAGSRSVNQILLVGRVTVMKRRRHSYSVTQRVGRDFHTRVSWRV